MRFYKSHSILHKGASYSVCMTLPSTSQSLSHPCLLYSFTKVLTIVLGSPFPVGPNSLANCCGQVFRCTLTHRRRRYGSRVSHSLSAFLFLLGKLLFAALLIKHSWLPFRIKKHNSPRRSEKPHQRRRQSLNDCLRSNPRLLCESFEKQWYSRDTWRRFASWMKHQDTDYKGFFEKTSNKTVSDMCWKRRRCRIRLLRED